MSGIISGVDDARSSPAGRLLRLVALLQSRRTWSGADLAEQLGVTERTVRRDVDRLRALDHAIDGTTGTAGGYRLRAGTRLPALVLDDDEAIAVAVGLARAGTAAVAGLEDSATRALAKLEHLLPPRLRPRLTALGTATHVVEPPGGERVDPSVLAVVAACCRDGEIVVFDHRTRAGDAAVRRVEPRGTVSFRDRWYLVGFDTDRDDWRIFRLDRVDHPRPSGRPAPERVLPAADPASFVVASFENATYAHAATVRLLTSAGAVRDALYPSSFGQITADGPDRCAVRLSADSPELVARWTAAVAGSGEVERIEADADVLALLQRAAETISRAVRAP